MKFQKYVRIVGVTFILLILQNFAAAAQDSSISITECFRKGPQVISSVSSKFGFTEGTTTTTAAGGTGKLIKKVILTSLVKSKMTDGTTNSVTVTSTDEYLIELSSSLIPNVNPNDPINNGLILASVTNLTSQEKQSVYSTYPVISGHGLSIVSSADLSCGKVMLKNPDLARAFVFQIKTQISSDNEKD